MEDRIFRYKQEEITFSKLFDCFSGWRAYAKWSDSEELSEEFKRKIIDGLLNQI